MTDPREMQSIDVTKWRTLGSISSDKLKALMQEETFASSFDNDFAARVGDRWRELQRTHYRFSFLIFSIILLLGTINSGWLREVTFLGITLSRENSTVSILVLFSAILMLFTSVLSLMSDHYGELLKSYIEVKKGHQVAGYHMLQYGWDLETFFNNPKSFDGNFSLSSITAIFILLWGAIWVAAMIILVFLELFLYVGAIISIFDSPKIPAFINVPIITVAICATLFQIGCFILRLPVPYSDLSNIKALGELDSSNPEQAREIRGRIATRNLQRERRNVTLLQTILFLSFLIGPYLLLFGQEFFSYFSILPKLVVPEVFITG